MKRIEKNLRNLACCICTGGKMEGNLTRPDEIEMLDCNHCNNSVIVEFNVITNKWRVTCDCQENAN